ncbi:MAG: hypothetical protein IMZ55_18830 [Acidobacteria bacterium]|nr:hypothetical protein [Acidobacteriota bacterium]
MATTWQQVLVDGDDATPIAVGKTVVQTVGDTDTQTDPAVAGTILSFDNALGIYVIETTSAAKWSAGTGHVNHIYDASAGGNWDGDISEVTDVQRQTIALVAEEEGYGQHAVTTDAIDTTGATLIVIAVGDRAEVVIPVITDSKSNVWQQLTEQKDAYARAALFYCESPVVGSGHTFTATLAWGRNNIVVMAFSGAGKYEAENGATDAASTGQPGAVSPLQDGEVVVSGICFVATGTASIDGGFTAYNCPGVSVDGAGAYLIQTTKAAANPTWTWSAGNAAMVIACFAAAWEATAAPPAAGGTKPFLLHRRRRG